MDRKLPLPSWFTPEQRNVAYANQLEARSKLWQCRCEQVSAESNRRRAGMTQRVEKLRSDVSDSRMERAMMPMHYAAKVREWLAASTNETGQVDAAALLRFIEQSQEAFEANALQAINALDAEEEGACPTPANATPTHQQQQQQQDPSVQGQMKRRGCDAFANGGALPPGTHDQHMLCTEHPTSKRFKSHTLEVTAPC